MRCPPYACLAALLCGAALAAPAAPAATGDPSPLVDLAATRFEEDRHDEALALLARAQTTAAADLQIKIADLRGRIACGRGRFAEARQSFAASETAAARLLGEDSRPAVLARLGLADVAAATGSAAEAEAGYRRCLASLTATDGPAAPDAVRAAVGLASMLRERGEFAAAEAVLRRRLEAAIAAHGPRSADAGLLTLHLAAVLGLSGGNAESIALFREAAAILEAAHGPDHSRTALGLSGLAHVTSSMGDQVEAAALYRRCLDIVEARHRWPHPAACEYLCRLAVCQARGETLDDSIALVRRSIAGSEAIHGPGSRQVAMVERQLGLLLLQRGDPQEARRVFLRALAVLEQAHGPVHPYLGPCLKGLGRACRKLGLLDEALHHADRAVAVFSDGSGRDQIERTIVLSWKSHVLNDAGRHDEAVATSLDACAVAREVLDEVYQVNSDRESAIYANYARMMSQSLLLAYTAHPRPPAAMTARVFAICAQTHGAVVDRLAQRQHYLQRAAGSPAIARARAERERAVQRVTELVLSGPQDDPAHHADRLAALRRSQDAAERALAAACADLRDDLPRRPGDRTRLQTEALAAALGPADRLLHFVYFPRRRDDGEADLHYGAFALQAGGRPLFVDLGPAAAVDSLVAAYRLAVESVSGDRRPTARQEADYRRTARALHDRVWSPLAVPTGGVAFVVPARSLYLVDLGGLLDRRGRPVIEDHTVHLLSSARDLLRPASAATGRGALVIGDPAAGATDPCPRPPGADTGGPLPGAADEARAVAALWAEATDEPVTLLTAAQCLEGAVKRHLVGKRVAHLATHGFFCEPSPDAAAVDPLILSGLIVTPDDAGGEDGLLTAGEVVALDLRGLDWVVLSACSSGRGRLVGVDGVFGLRRAFVIAGARTVVMALWRVGDRRLASLMQSILRHRLAGAGTAAAIRMAQLERLHEARDRWRRVHPALWGGVVAEGDWR